MIDFTFCKNFAHAETKSVEWHDFAATMSRSKAYGSKEESIKRSAFIGGVRDDEERGRADNVRTRTVVTLDYDELDLPLDEIEFMLDLALGDVAFVAWSTFRHTPEHPRVRVCVPLSRRVSAEEHSAIVDALVNRVAIGQPDDCSYTINQIMFLPSHQQGVEPWAFRGHSDEFLDVEAVLSEVGFEEGFISSGGVEDEVDDLSLALASQPLDISEDEIRVVLEAYPAEGKDYDEWLRVGMAIWHQTEGAGYETWRAWSAKSGKHDERHMRTKWRSFGGTAKPVTMASIIALTGGRRGGVAVVEPDGEVALSLEQEAEQVADRASYSAFKRRVQSLNEVQLPPDIRSLLASVVHEVYAKGAGMGLREVKAAMKPLKASRASLGEDGVSCPDWLADWVYAEADCQFVNTTVSDYAIKREAFRAKFDRRSEVIGMETDAATFALNMVQIPTVVRPMYWPGQPAMFTSGWKAYVNSYHASGLPPAESIDADGQSVVDLVIQHVRNTIESEREGDLLLDFLSYVYRTPGKRVRWGLLLWGIEGNGKTFFYWLLQLLLGSNATVISTSMIERPFNDWAVGARLIGIEEIRISGTNKWRVLDQLKPMISNDTIAVEPKGATRYHAPNFASYLMTTNHLDAVPMSDNDRRYCVIFSRQRGQDDLFAQHGGREATARYFDTLFSECERRIDAIGRWLLERELSPGFNPHGRAPETLGQAEMRSANVSDDRQAIEEAIEDHACEIVGHDLLDVTYLNSCVVSDGGELPVKRALANVLRDMGYRQIENRRVKVRGAYHYVWYRGQEMGPKAAGLVRDFFSGDQGVDDVPF